MAIDLYTETSSSRTMSSPRISFSHDLNNCDIIPIEPHHHIPLKTTSSLLDYDFDFNVSKRRCDQDSSLADELFANGVILPIQIKRKNLPTTIPKSKSLPHSSLSTTPQNINISKAVNVGSHSHVTTTTEVRYNDDNNNNKSFWQLKRSKSVNCGRIYRRGLCSLPLLSRSKSSGSTTSSNNNGKKALITKDEQEYYTQRQASLKKNLGSNNHQKPPLKKHYYGGSSFNSGLINVSPVINVTTGNLFGFCSIFSNGKDKAKKK